MDPDKENEISEEYMSSLMDLTVNSKPLINMLTMLAEDNIDCAQVIVRAVEQHLAKVPPEVKLPVLYLIDSIVKNVGKQYKTLFSVNIVNLFCGVFEKVNEGVRTKMFNLRQTWNEVFPNTKLYALDVKVNVLDPNWPITAKVAPSNTPATIHVNPNFFKQKPGNPIVNDEIQKQLKDKERELLELQKRKLELELLATKKKLEEQEKEMGEKLKITEKVQKVIPPVAITAMPMIPSLLSSHPMPNRPRIAPVTNPAMLAKSRDPRLARQQPPMAQQPIQPLNNQQPFPQMPPHMQRLPNGGPSVRGTSYGLYPSQAMSKMLPKIPKFSSSGKQPPEGISTSGERRERDRERVRDRDSRRERDEKSKSSSSREKSRSSEKSSSRSSGKSSDRKKSSSGDEKSPRKRKEESSPKKSSSKSPSSKSSSSSRRSSKSPDRKSSKSLPEPPPAPIVSSAMMKDVDLRVLPTIITPIPSVSPGSSSDDVKKATKQENDNLLKKLLQEDAANETSNQNVNRSSPVPTVTSTSSPRDPMNELAISEATKQDIDLRMLISAEDPLTSQKRLNNETTELEPTTKKSKADKIDPLFGNEDVDLRTLPLRRSRVPVPPVITSSGPEESTSKQDDPPHPVQKKKISFEEVRAKLAKATEKKNQEDPERKRKLSDKKISSLDTDLRNEFKLDLEMDENLYKDAFNDNMKTIFQQAKDQLEDGKIDKDQYNDTVTQLIKMSEKQKIIDVKRQEILSSKRRDPRLEDSDSENSNSNSNHSFPKRTRFSQDDKPRSDVPLKDRKNRESKWGPVPEPIPPMPMPPLMPILPPPGFINPWEQNPLIVQQMQLLQQSQVLQQNIVNPVKKDEIPINNQMRTVRLDGVNDYLLRFYDETAIIFEHNGQSRNIRFSAGYSVVVIDDLYKVALNFNDDYKPITIDGKLHQIKFGAPTREIYIDDCYYECYFNNRPTQIVLDGKLRTIKIDGKAPEVKVGRERPDLVLGRINVIVDAEQIIPVFLDTTTQLFEVKGQIHTLQFADFFKTVLINGEPHKIEFGGMPKNFNLKGQKHFIRFTDLPENIEPGQVNLAGFVRTRFYRDLKSPPLMLAPVEEPPAPAALPLPFADLNPSQNEVPAPVQQQVTVPQVVPNLSINELFQKLVATGIINKKSTSDASSSAADDKKAPKEVEKKKVTPVSFSRPETIKVRQQGIVDSIYSGMQCSSCGLRFPPEQTIKYSQHLDWHFRQNRRDRDSQRRAHSRKWYYDCADWIRYEEIEDLEEREKNFFETQQIEAMDQAGDDSNHARSGADNASVPSCPAGPDDLSRRCDMCHDQFEQFYNEETEEWHLRLALKIDDKFYHPICYEDYKASLTLDESAISSTLKESENEEESEEIRIKREQSVEGTQAAKNDEDDDDDDVIVLPNEEPVVTEIPDDDESGKKEEEQEPDKKENEEEDKEQTSDPNMTDDDVMIQEQVIETQNLVDDDDDEQEGENVGESDQLQKPLVIKIKEEPKDDGYEENEEDNFMEVSSIANNFIEDTFSNSPLPTTSNTDPADSNVAELHEINDNAVMISPSTNDENSHFSVRTGDDDDEEDEDRRADHMNQEEEPRQQEELFDMDESSHPDHQSHGQTQPSGQSNKIKIVLSSLMANNLNSNRISNNHVVNNNNNNLDDSSNLESANKLDSLILNHDNNPESMVSNHHGQQMSCVDLLHQEYELPDIQFEVKPQLKGLKFDKSLVPVKRGLENSGLCSIM